MISLRLSLFLTFLLSLASCAQSPTPASNHVQSKSTRVIEESISLQAFILINYSQLSSDILHGKGAYLDGLFALSGIHSSNEHPLIQKMQKLLIKELDIYLFSVEINQLLRESDFVAEISASAR